MYKITAWGGLGGGGLGEGGGGLGGGGLGEGGGGLGGGGLGKGGGGLGVGGGGGDGGLDGKLSRKRMSAKSQFQFSSLSTTR